MYKEEAKAIELPDVIYYTENNEPYPLLWSVLHNIAPSILVKFFFWGGGGEGRLYIVKRNRIKRKNRKINKNLPWC